MRATVKAATTQRPLSTATASRKAAAIIPTPLARPSMMSIRLRALDSPTSHRIVTT